jgi:hypothetical protein
MVKLLERLELEWKVTENDGEERLWITQLGVFCLAGYARALRGEEITKMNLVESGSILWMAEHQLPHMSCLRWWADLKGSRGNAIT